ncbi:PhoU family transcriptional regulator [Candidatus Bathyarchaeota archaeon]|nr:PhoU family transcriptional regulator [Candidatus Bathyarchaeota archaeon]
MDETEKLLLQVKDTSEIMLDLAYSSLIFSDREIADEVLLLADYVKELNSQLEEIVIERVSRDKDLNRAITYIRLSRAMEDIADSAEKIADVVLRDIKVHPVLAESILESGTSIAREVIAPGSVLAGTRLRETSLATDTGWFVIVVKRGQKWIIGPDGEAVLEPGDTIFARGPLESRGHLCRLCRGRTQQVQFVPDPSGEPDLRC